MSARSAKRRARHVFLDLDGTLTDPRQGIVRSLQHALASMGTESPEPHALERWIGPPLAEAFEVLLGTRDRRRIEPAIGFYRERFSDVGIFENALHPGVPDALRGLRSDGHTLWVATSKPTVFAERIVEHFGISRYLDGVFGAELDGRGAAKASVLAHALAQARAAPPSALMVGDREHDVRGARAHGVDCLAVTWGFGSRDELERAHPAALVESVADLVPAVRGLGPARRPRLAAGAEPAPGELDSGS